MGDRQPHRPIIVNEGKRYIPVRNVSAASRGRSVTEPRQQRGTGSSKSQATATQPSRLPIRTPQVRSRSPQPSRIPPRSPPPSRISPQHSRLPPRSSQPSEQPPRSPQPSPQPSQLSTPSQLVAQSPKVSPRTSQLSPSSPPSPQRSQTSLPPESQLPQLQASGAAQTYGPPMHTSVIPSRQARPPVIPSYSRSRQQPSSLMLEPSVTPSGAPLSQPHYELDWLPEDDLWLKSELDSAYLQSITDGTKGRDITPLREFATAGGLQHDMFTDMLEVGATDDLIGRFLDKGFEEDEAEQRETEYFEKLERMIAEEADDIDLALTLSRLDMEIRPRKDGTPVAEFQTDGQTQRQKQRFQRGLRDVHRGIEAMTILAEEDEPEEVQPELAAAMMYTEECGPVMTNAPSDMFAFLFGQMPGADLDQADEEGSVVQEDGELISSGPCDVEQKPGEQTSKPISQPGAEPTAVSGAAQHRVPTSRKPYTVPRKPVTQRFNLVQMCGSHPPFWFRGYFEAFPHTVGRIAISGSPSTTLQTAWYLTKPEIFGRRKMMIPGV